MISIDGVALVKEIATYLKGKDKDPNLVRWFMELQAVILEMIDERATLLQRIRNIEKELKTKEELRFNKSYGVWEGETNGETLRYCPRCRAGDKLVPMRESDMLFSCGCCGSCYNKPEAASSIHRKPTGGRVVNPWHEGFD